MFTYILNELKNEATHHSIENVPRRYTMKVEFLTVRWNNIFSIVLLCVAVFFVTAVLAGANVPFAGGGISSFITLVVIGGIG